MFVSKLSGIQNSLCVNLDGFEKKKICIDIVCNGGHTWVKVVARNPEALHMNSKV